MTLPASSAEPEIIVRGYTDRYVRAFDRLLGIEGGLVNDPVDRGGTTKFGISLRFLVANGDVDEDSNGWADFDLDMDGDIDGADIRQLTIGDARYLYHTHFWLDLDAESFPVPLGEALFDQAVNGGARAARKLLQQAINECLASQNLYMIEVDGQIGPQTRSALELVLGKRSLGTDVLMAAFRQVASDRYRAIAAADISQKRFLKGWLRRARELGA